MGADSVFRNAFSFQTGGRLQDAIELFEGSLVLTISVCNIYHQKSEVAIEDLKHYLEKSGRWKDMM